MAKYSKTAAAAQLTTGLNQTWVTFLKGIMLIPGAKIRRADFLRQTFPTLTSEQLSQCLELSPAKVLPAEQVQKVADGIIMAHTRRVSALSALSGIPGGWAMLATIPADLANYYVHIVAVGQKLAYLYGYPDMLNDEGNLTVDGEMALTAFIGVMNRVAAAREIVKKIASEVSRRVSEETATRIAGNILSKQAVSQAIEVMTHRLGAQITAKSGGRVLTKVIPLVSGAICGVMTYRTFLPQARRLQQALQ